MTVDLGIQGLSIEPGSHLCAFYSGDTERKEILVPFLEQAMRAKDRCICLIERAAVETVLKTLETKTSIKPDEDWLDVQTSEETYLVDGHFDREGMLAFWVRTYETAKARGWSFVRVISDASCIIRSLPEVNEFMVYESKYNQIARRYPQVTVCIYDLNVFGPKLLIEILRTHPRVLVGGVVHENPDYMAPEEFLANRDDVPGS